MEKYLKPTAEDIKNKTGYDGSYASAKNAVESLIQRHHKHANDIQDHFGMYLENTPIGRQDGYAIVGHYNNLRDNYRLTTEEIDAHYTPA